MPFRYPFAFPPQGPVLILLAVLYLVPGLLGHDPWKTDDAVQIAAAVSLWHEGHWLAPALPGTSGILPPLLPWLGAVFIKLLPFLPAHDAARLPVGLATALAFLLLGNAAADLHGRAQRPVTILIALGTLGFLAHGHEAQPAMLLFLGIAAVLRGLIALRRNPAKGRVAAGLGIACAFLAAGLPGLMLTLPLLLLPFFLPAWRRDHSGSSLLFSAALGLALAAVWPLLLAALDPAALGRWWQDERTALLAPGFSAGRNILDYLALLGWFAWPAWPLALWTLWHQRRRLGEPGVMLPLAACVLLLLLTALRPEVRNPGALPLLAPLILLATPGAGNLRRGAANAFDWFAMMTASLLLFLVWLGWTAMTLGVPARLAASAARLVPGFQLAVSPLLVLLAAALTLAWLWLIFASPRRSPWRGTTHWAVGMVTLWCLVMTLWLPPLDFARSYRFMAADLARHLPASGHCVSARNLGVAQLASLYYFNGLVTRPGSDCAFLLTQASDRERDPAMPGWTPIWTGHRASDRHELYTLYRRDASLAPAATPSQHAGRKKP